MAVRRPRAVASTRVRGAQVLAFVALVAALVGALGPATKVRTSYSWPPATLPAGTPERAWYTPLLLARHVAETIVATVPCELAPPLPGAGERVVVLATSPIPARPGRLELTGAGDELELSVGGQVLARLPCPFRLRVEDGRWSIEGEPSRGGELEVNPVVFGLFSELDLRAGPTPSIEVVTAVHRTRTIARQVLAWSIAALAIAAALLLVAVERKPRPLATLRRALGSARANAHAVDAAVGIGLLGWWVLSPMFADDGWVAARQRMFASSGGFSAYFAALGVNLPLDYWLEWVEHWLAEATTALVFLRVPSLLCLAATWVLCRWILARMAPRDGVVLWALASAFLVAAMSWGMTLRPEPKIALLVTASVACMVRFAERETAAPLAAAAVLVPLAVTGHHTGIVALAPVLVLAPRLLRWARSRLPVAATILSAALALVALLLFVGADLEQRSDDARATAELGTSGDTWRDELHRYTRLDEFPYGTPLRRASVALGALAIFAFAIRRRRARRQPLDLPALALAAAALLLVATPSKWPWHFGALAGLMALAVAAETSRLRETGRRLEPLLVAGAASMAAAWTWWEGPRRWGLVDLHTLDWTLGIEEHVPLWLLALLLQLALLAAVFVRPRAAAWATAAIAAPVIAFTVAVLVADTATSSWTIARQNLDVLTGDSGCGLADDLAEPPPRRSLVLPELLPYFPCTELPQLRNGVAEVPDGLVVPARFLPSGWAPTSPFGGIFELYRVRRPPLENAPPDLWVYRIDRRIPGALLAPPAAMTITS